MGSMIDFPANGGTCSGYLATPDGAGPGVLVIQEYWGLVPHIIDVCERFAAEGFVALAPDLYRGETASEPDEAGKLMMALNLSQAAKDTSGAVDAIVSRPECSSTKVGVVGFCMGGGLALMTATRRPDIVGACVPFYGVIPWANVEPDYAAIGCPIRGHFAELDSFFAPDMVRSLESRLRDLGKDVELVIHPGVDHAFFNDTRPEVYDEPTARRCWSETLSFLRSELR